MALTTTGSIASTLAEMYGTNLDSGISGNLITIVDAQRITVQNFTNTGIDANAIPEKFQSAIFNFSQAEVIDLNESIGQGQTLKLEDLSISENQSNANSNMLRQMAMNSLKYIGRSVGFRQSLT